MIHHRSRAICGAVCLVVITAFCGAEPGLAASGVRAVAKPYQFDERWSAFTGYRAMKADYRNGNFIYNALQQGPCLA